MQLEHSQNQQSAKNLTFTSYILFFLGVVSVGIFSTIGVILAYVRRKGLENTIFYSHLSYLIKTFWNCACSRLYLVHLPFSIWFYQII